ncbi:MAG: hypothetical protein ACJAYF_002179 [Arenicella sp.]|jgi:hypothetical protein
MLLLETGLIYSLKSFGINRIRKFERIYAQENQ